ncbi:MAG: Gfo/Idh/MocA family oxidoreductase, partial [Candidatus Peribacteraceae bacterium]
GKSILCEKPFTLSSEIAEHLYKEARAAGIVHAVDFEFRELPALKLIKKRLEDGTVGEIKNAKIIWLVGFWADPERPWRWQCDRDAGGGVLGALGVHLFDMVEWFFGPVKKLRAEMDISIKNRTDVSGTLREVTAEDHADIELVCENGISVKMLLSNAERSGAGLSMDIQGHRNSIFLRSTSQEYGRGLQVMEGGNEKESRLLQTAEDIPVQVDSRVPPFHALAGRLVHAILKKHISFHPSFFEGMRAQMIREAALQSSSAGGWVEIAERVP